MRGMKMADKADASDFLGRFREIVSDPLNLLIQRHPLAGTVENGNVVLHNGNRVPVAGAGAYYNNFSDILVINRGVHEPLEEFVFQTVLARLPERPVMLELGAYWCHYSMWCLTARPEGRTFLVEPDGERLASGEENFLRNGFSGQFERGFVGPGQFEVDVFMAREGLPKLDILHCDIQGAELDMINGAGETLSAHKADYVFVSTHSQKLHRQVTEAMLAHGYRVEASADFDHETTSFDGFILAVAPSIAQVFHNFRFLSRIEITQTSPDEILGRLVACSENF